MLGRSYYETEPFPIKMKVQDRTVLAGMLRQSILRLCQETVAYEGKLEVDGIVCITLENDTQQIVIKVHELLHKNNVDPFQSRNVHSLSYNGVLPRLTSYAPPNSPSTRGTTFEFTQSGQAKPSWPRSSPHDVFPMKDSSERSIKSEPLGENCSFSEPSPMEEGREEGINDDSSNTSALSEGETGEYRYGDSGHIPHPTNGASIATSQQLKKSDSFDQPSLERDIEISPPPLRVKTTPEDLSLAFPNEMSANQPVLCKLCDLVLSNPRAFETHSLEVHNSFTCGFCLHTFTSRPNLQRHIRLHTGQKPYPCPMCSSRFSRRDDLKGHILKHSYSKPFRCNLCGKGYTDRSCLRNHMRKEHNAKLLHVCSQCGEGFDDIQRSMEHKKEHPELKGFQCHVCNFVGTNALSHQKHLLLHTLLGKTYTCVVCNVPYTDPFMYSEHLKQHRSDPKCCTFTCCFCDNVLPTYDQFVRHEHSHAHNKNYNCSSCPAQFKSAINLKLHSLNHSKTGASEEEELESARGGSQYWCTECNTGFSSEMSLHEHINTIHEEGRERKFSLDNMSDQSSVDKISDFCENHRISNGLRTSYDDGETDEIQLVESEPMNLSITPSPAQVMQHHGQPLIYRAISAPLIASKESAFREGFTSNSRHVSSTEAHPGFMSAKVCSDIPLRSTMLPVGGVSQEYNKDLLQTHYLNANSPMNLTNQDSVSDERKQSPLSPTESTSDSGTEGTRDNPGMRSISFDRITTPDVMFRSNTTFKCDLCQTDLENFDALEKHSNQLHKRYLCEYCGKSFTAKPNRDRHVRYHTGERPYKCDLCTQSFFRGDDLKYHRTTRHSTVKPFHCSVCGLSFSWARDLERHIRTHV